jgi:hypothetical protein
MSRQAECAVTVTDAAVPEDHIFYTFVARWRATQWVGVAVVSADWGALASLWEAPTDVIFFGNVKWSSAENHEISSYMMTY